MKIRSIDPGLPDEGILSEAADVIRGGGLVAFPTETVYGIGADGTNPAAIRRIYEAKGRPESKPILVLVSGKKDLERLVQCIPSRVDRLMDACWPGPLTLVFPASCDVPRELLGTGSTIGVRHSGARVARSLCRAAGCPVTAPSANRSGGAEPVTAADVAAQIGDRIDLILDGGASPSDQPSTVVDVSEGAPRLIRSGCMPFNRVLDLWQRQPDPVEPD